MVWFLHFFFSLKMHTKKYPEEIAAQEKAIHVSAGRQQ